MPTYHFRCPSCKTETDRKLPFGSTETPLCDACKTSMEKFIVPPHVHFKGGGFYKNDAKSSPEKKETPVKKPDPPKTPPPPPSAPTP